MEAVTTAARNAWRSERLVYKHYEPTNAEQTQWLQENVMNDPESAVLGGNIILKPRDLAESTKLVADSMPKALIGVLIYLPAEKPAKTDSEEAGENNTKKASEDTLIGFAQLSGGSPFTAHLKNGDAAIVLGAEHQGKGYGREGMQWLVDWGFRFGNLHRIGLRVYSYNERAIGLYKKMGFVEEGRFREALWFDRKFYDTVCMSMLVHEWEAIRDGKK